jgi:hypothetical protein
MGTVKVPRNFTRSHNQTWKCQSDSPVMYVCYVGTTEISCHFRIIYKLFFTINLIYCSRFFSSLLHYDVTLCHWASGSHHFVRSLCLLQHRASLMIKAPWFFAVWQAACQLLCCIPALLRDPKLCLLYSFLLAVLSVSPFIAQTST